MIITGGVVPLRHCNICPASYHISCLPPSARASCSAGATWTCPRCKSGRRPLYGDIVWVKYSNYRSALSDVTTEKLILVNRCWKTTEISEHCVGTLANNVLSDVWKHCYLGACWPWRIVTICLLHFRNILTT